MAESNGGAAPQPAAVRAGRGWKLAVVAVVAGALVTAFAIKPGGKPPAPPAPARPGAVPASQAQPGVTVTKGLPRLVDLGADKCLPCKMMVPVLDELRREYRGKLDVVFHDVWKNPQAGRDYSIRVIPTQVFFDTQGKEFFRHEGYLPKADILTKFKGHGINLGGGK